jgi:hypothetical protein
MESTVLDTLLIDLPDPLVAPAESGVRQKAPRRIMREETGVGHRNQFRTS